MTSAVRRRLDALMEWVRALSAEHCPAFPPRHGRPPCWRKPDGAQFWRFQRDEQWLAGGARALYNTAMSWIDQRPDDAMDGAFTVIGPEPVRTVEAAAFREAMARLGAAV